MKKVAFICVHNSCRSQIAEALGKKLASDVFESYSAGTETKPQINQDAVRLMKQVHGIDMEATQYSKLLSDIPAVDVVITMGCNVQCPFLPCSHREDWGLEDPTTVEGFSYDSMWQFAFGIEPGAYDLNVGDKLSFMEFYYDNESEKTCYIKWNLEIVDFIDTEADNYKGAPSSKESELALTVGTPVALQAMQEAFQLSKFQFNQALNAGQISTENFIDGEKVDPSAGGFGGVWFDAEGKRTVWGTGAEDNPETPDVNEAATPACYYIELISSATDLSAYSNYYAEDSAAQVAGKTFNNFKQVVTYTPAEGESYTFTINYTVTF